MIKHAVGYSCVDLQNSPQYSIRSHYEAYLAVNIRILILFNVFNITVMLLFIPSSDTCDNISFNNSGFSRSHPRITPRSTPLSVFGLYYGCR